MTKKAYQSPTLQIHGTVEQMTQVLGESTAGDYLFAGCDPNAAVLGTGTGTDANVYCSGGKVSLSSCSPS